jgi:drug/metabolite transporter (DMT)-like permease
MAVELALLGVLSLAWGSAYGLTKVALETITPLTAVASRCALAALLLWLVVLWRGHRTPTDRATWGRFLVQSLLQSAFPFTLITWGQQYVDSGLAGVLNSTSPIFVVLITLIWTRHERVGAEQLLGLALGLGGVMLIVGLEAIGGFDRGLAGQLAIVIATFGFALAYFWARKLEGVPVEVAAAGTMATAALTLVPFALAIEAPWRLEPSVRSLAALFVQAGFGAAIGFLIYFRLTRTLGSIGTSSVAYLKAGVSVLIGVALLGEPFGWSLGLGLLAVMLGVALINGQLGRLLPGRPPRPARVAD